MDKHSLRKKFLAIRKKAHASISDDEKQLIFRHLLQIPQFLNAKTIMLYMSKNSEVPTEKLILSLLNSGKKIALPHTNIQDTSITPYYISSLSQLEPSSFGVLEPNLKCKICYIKNIDIIIVPGIAFDEKRMRLGYGLGFYDRFLSSASSPSIGICYDAQISPSPLPHEHHDIPLNFVASEKRIIKKK
ncbi:MAG: 5-formyltetrahydrofolate cyclo-ligase [Candidatus Micrarchaeota archaeon]